MKNLKHPIVAITIGSVLLLSAPAVVSRSVVYL